MVKLSIVIPYFETYDLTKRLLDILLPQLTDETELIIIDDGCDERRFDDLPIKHRVKLVHQPNSGVSVSRNIGVSVSIGKYIAFIDSDDMIADDYVRTLIETMNYTSAEVITFNWQDLNNGMVILRPSNYAIWKSIYKKEIVPRFIEDMKQGHEDVPFIDEIESKNYNKYYINKVLYYYNSNRTNSLTWRRKNLWSY